MQLCIALSFSVAFLVAGVTGSDQCSPIAKCSDAQVQVIQEDQTIPSDIIVPSETDVGNAGHFSGLKPLLYNMTLVFFNETHYEGELEIQTKAVQRTKRIMVNTHVASPIFDKTAITVLVDCNGPANAPSMCIKKLTYIAQERVLVIDLTEELLIDQQYTLRFPSFTGHVWNDDEEIGAYGLRKGSLGGSYPITTLFKMRHARSVFPCMDHPSLRAQFELTLEYPSELLVASTAPKNGEATASSQSGRHRQKFQRIPSIPTYTFGFALMKDYVELTNSTNTNVGVLLLKIRPERKTFILYNMLFAYNYFSGIANKPFSLPRLNLLLAHVSQQPTSGGFGLFTVEPKQMLTEESKRQVRTAVLQGVIQQWIGGMVTVKNWHEVCLQEGLSTYFAWVMLEKFYEEPVSDKTSKVVKEYLRPYQSYLGRTYDYSEEVADQCSKLPAVFYHMIASHYGVQTLERFVAKLVNQNPEGSVGADSWDQLLAEVSGEPHVIKGFVKGWFDEPGPAVVVIKSQYNSITLLQTPTNLTGAIRPLPISVTSFSSNTPQKAVLKSELLTLSIPSNNWYIADIEATTPTIRLYERSNYLKVFNATISTTLTKERKRLFAENFCQALVNGLLPLPGDFDANDWKTIFASARSLSPSCYCCLRLQGYTISRCESAKCNFSLYHQLRSNQLP